MAYIKILINETILKSLEQGDIRIELNDDTLPASFVSLPTEGGSPKVCWVRFPDSIRKSIEIPAASIVYVKYEGDKLITAYTQSGQKYNKSISLKAFLQELADMGYHSLMKVHDAHALNVEAVQLVACFPNPYQFQIKIDNAFYDIPIGKLETYKANATWIKTIKGKI